MEGKWKGKEKRERGKGEKRETGSSHLFGRGMERIRGRLEEVGDPLALAEGASLLKGQGTQVTGQASES